MIASEKPKVEMDRTRTKTEYDEKSKLEIYCFDRCGGICGNYFSKDGKFLSPAEDPRVNITFDYDEFGGQKGVLLTITNMTLNDSGQYECGLLAPRYSDRINITVKGKPFVFLYYVSEQQLKPAEIILLQEIPEIC